MKQPQRILDVLAFRAGGHEGGRRLAHRHREVELLENGLPRPTTATAPKRAGVGDAQLYV